jgi:1-acyl-sn-glycerol-3-phosphate acyltransferase
MFLYKLVRAIILPFVRLILPFKVLKKDRLNSDTGRLIICNHFRILDVAYISSLQKEQIHFIGKSELFKSKIGKWFFTKVGVVPVNRDKTDALAIIKGIKLLKEGKKISIFPEGTRNKTTDKELLEIKGGAGIFAIKSKCPIQPVMMLKKPRYFKTTYLMVGEPFELSEYYDKKLTSDDYDTIGNIIKDEMLKLKNELKEYLISKGKKI